jgi:transposase
MDVHKKSISVCVRVRSARDHFETETAVFRTFTRDLEQMAEWLKARKVRRVAMESTGVYWKPVWNVLEALQRSFHPPL